MIQGTEIHVLDRNAEYHGVPNINLMEYAGQAVANYIKENHKQQKILLFCGTGNNGGDGFVAARHLAENYEVSVFLTGKEQDIKTTIAQENYNKIKTQNITLYDNNNFEKLDYLVQENELIIDAMLGIGFSGELREPYSTIIQKLRSQNKTIISVDVPTGLGTDDCILPTHTITFHDTKHGMTKENSGEIHTADIGIPKEAQTYIGPGELTTYYPKSKPDSHKGENGTVLVIGGGPYVGAPALAGLAALRTGADLVMIATPKRSWLPIASMSPNLIVKDLHSNILTPGDIPVIRDLLNRCNSVVIGPGMGEAKETEDAVIKIIELVISEKKPLVIDADALKPIKNQLGIIKNSKTVITPHSREFTKISGIKLSNKTDINIETVEFWTHEQGITTLLKGPIDIITNGEQSKLNNVHNPAMTVGGTGDVLSGITGALLAKKVDPYNAARIAAFLNGAAGNQAFEKYSYGLLATDILEEIPIVLKNYL